MVTITVRSVQENTYRPNQLMIELGLGKTQFSKWIKALGLNKEGGRKHFYDASDRAHLLRFRALLNQYDSLEIAFTKWRENS